MRVHYTEVAYLEFVDMLTNNQLCPGSLYLITDFRTRNPLWDDITSTFNEAAVEPLLVRAIANNAYDKSVNSPQYPDDIIQWTHDNFRDGADRGVIFYRKRCVSQKTYESCEDFVGVVYRRWETTLGSGVYDSTAPTLNGFSDFPHISGSSNTCIKNNNPVWTYTVIQDSYVFVNYCTNCTFNNNSSITVDFITKTYTDSTTLKSTGAINELKTQPASRITTSQPISSVEFQSTVELDINCGLDTKVFDCLAYPGLTGSANISLNTGSNYYHIYENAGSVATTLFT